MSKISQTIDNVAYELVAHQDGTQAFLLNGKVVFTRDNANTSTLQKTDSNDVVVLNGDTIVADGSFTKDGYVCTESGLIYDVVTSAEGTRTLFSRNTDEVCGTFEQWAEIKIQKAVTEEDPAKTPTEQDTEVVETPAAEEEPEVVETPAAQEEPEVVETPETPTEETETKEETTEPEEAPETSDDVVESEGCSEDQTFSDDKASADHQESESPAGSLAPAVFVPVLVGAAMIFGLGSFVAHRLVMNKKALRAKNSKLGKASKN
jgi:hypothetical protein